MAATLEAVPSTKPVEKLTEKSEAEAARELVRMAKEQGLSLTGPDGLLKQPDKRRSSRPPWTRN
jgi:putative transposase